jgi:hypothetical protein
MKRLSLITVCLVAVTLTAVAQVPAHYAEEYEKETGKLRGKVWFAADGSFRQETSGENGRTSVIIVRRDSMAAYHLNTANKTYMKLDIASITDGLGGGKLTGIEDMETAKSNIKSTFRGKETVEGVECEHYFHQRTDALKGGGSSSADYDEWVYPADKIWRQRSDDIRPGRYLVQRNIRVGAQPTSMFEIPRDYKGSGLPAGVMGISKDEQAKVDAKAVTINDLINQLNEADKIQDPQKRREEQTRIMQEMNNLNKKK